MSNGSSVAYRLRPNKAVDRELFLSLLGRLAAHLTLENYCYIGLGGPFLEDFRLIHARLGITDMKCVEMEENTHKRQLFNCPIETIECIHSSLEDYVYSAEYDAPVVLWFDYTHPGALAEQVEIFARTTGEVPIGSILRITLNANPAALGDPPAGMIMQRASRRSTKTRDAGQTLQGFRLEKFRERLGTLYPSGMVEDDMTKRRFGASLLRVLHLAVDKVMLSFNDRKAVWALATHYADGQSMVTATLMICESEDTVSEDLIKKWAFHSTPLNPEVIDMPALSTLERLTMESKRNAEEEMGFKLPKSEMGSSPYASFKRFYRVFPHFSRVEL